VHPDTRSSTSEGHSLTPLEEPAPVHEEDEEEAGRQEQAAREVVREREAHKERGEEQVEIPPLVSPDQKDEDYSCHEEGVQGVDLGDHRLRPERLGEGEEEGGGEGRRGPAGQPPADEVETR
jgi:hypothetical protein